MRSIAGGFRDIKPKPVVPLRYRICRHEKKLDELDRLENELEKAIDNGMEYEDYQFLRDVLDNDRAIVATKRLKAAGRLISEREEQAKANLPVSFAQSSDETTEPHSEDDRQSSHNFGVWFFIFIFCLAIGKYFLTG